MKYGYFRYLAGHCYLFYCASTSNAAATH